MDAQVLFTHTFMGEEPELSCQKAPDGSSASCPNALRRAFVAGAHFALRLEPIVRFAA